MRYQDRKDDHYPKDLSGWLELVHPEQQEEMSHYLNNHILTEHNLFEKMSRIIRHNDRQERWVFGLGELEFDANGNPIKIIGTIQDITERKRTEGERERLITELETKNAELERFTYTVSHDLKSPLW